jgi:hypothetical protein
MERPEYTRLEVTFNFRVRIDYPVCYAFATLQVLLDWSEKLSLEPMNSGTGQTYKRVGVLVAIVVRRVGGRTKAETCVGIFDEPINDVPHTHAFLRKLLTTFCQEAEAAGTTLRDVSIWSDGGQNHFKSGEAFVFASHLKRVFHDLGGKSFQWNFMQSNHGKGPYDAEGS